MNGEFDAAWLGRLSEAAREGGPNFQAELDRFLRAHRARALAIVRRTFDGVTVAELDQVALDVVATAVMDFLRGLALYRGAASPTTYYLTMVARRAVRARRRKRWTYEIPEARLPEGEPVGSNVPRAGLPESERVAHRIDIADALEELAAQAPDLAAALVANEMYGTAEEAAAALGISVAAFRKRLHRARLLLREYLSDDEEG